MFCNLYFLKAFRDHNFSNFWFGSGTAARIERISEKAFESYLDRSFQSSGTQGGTDLPPDFDPIVIFTLSPKCCASFIRTNPDWPYDERDYYLSKIYQYVLAVLDSRFKVWDSNQGNEVGKRVEALLDLVPRELLPPTDRVDWFQLFWQVWRAAQTGTVTETLQALEDGLAELLGLTLAQIQKAAENQELPSRRYGPQPDMESHRRVHEIVSKYPNWKGQKELEAICEKLTVAGIAIPESWRTRRQPANDWVGGLETDKELTIKAIEYRLRQAARARGL